MRCFRLARRLLFSTALTAVFVLGPVVRGQPPSLRVQHLTADEGLSQVSVQAVLIDSRGFLWVGTQGGLNRWDGTEFEVFGHDPRNPRTISHGHVVDLVEDDLGRLWIATLVGLDVYDPRQGDIHRLGSTPGSFAHGAVQALELDASGRLWIGSDGKGLAWLDLDAGLEPSFQVVDLPPEAMGVRTLLADGSWLWIGTRSGLFRADLLESGPGHVEAIDLTDAMRGMNVHDLLLDGQSRLLVGTDRGLARLDPTTGATHIYRHDDDDPTSLASDTVRSLAIAQGRLWVGTDRGLNLFEARRDHFIRYRNDPADPWSLVGDNIVVLENGPGSLLWIGTLTGGLDRFDMRSWQFGPRLPTDGLVDGLPSAPVTSFAEDPAGDIWIGTMGGGLTRWRRSQGRFQTFHKGSDPPSRLPDDQVMTLLVDHRGDLWVGTRKAGLARLRRGTDTFDHYPADSSDPTSPASEGIVTLFEDSHDTLWVGTFRAGLDRYDPQTDSFIHYPPSDDPRSLAAGTVQALAEDKGGRLWIATFGGGLHLHDRRHDDFLRFSADPDHPASLPSDTLTSLHTTPQGALWIGTYGSGLSRLERLHGETAEFQTWSEPDRLPNNTILGIQSDAGGRLWIATNNGLVHFEPESSTWRRFSIRHGLAGHDFMFGAHYRNTDGELFFGGAVGFNAFDPSLVKFVSPESPVVLTGLELGNRPALGLAPELTESLSLDHTERSIAFEFAALDFIAPEEVRYSYRLEPFDDDWIETTRRRATYTNLDAGDYVFAVRATNADGKTSTDGLSIQIAVAAAPWNTWWARTAYLLFGLALLYIGVRWRLAGLERRSAELEALVATRTIELSDTVEQLRVSEAEAVEARRRALRSLEEALQERRRAQAASQAKSQFLSSMSHELRTPLNAVLGFAQLMERDTDLAAGHRESLSTILRSGEHLLGLINDVLSLSKIEAGKLLLNEEPFDVRRTVADLDAMLRVRAESEGLVLHMDVAPAVPTAVFGDAGRLAQVLLNLLGNAVKFTDEGHVTLRVGYEAGEATFDVQDSGCGIAAEEIDRLFEPFAQTPGGHAAEGTGLGLPISQELVRLMGGDLSVESQLGVGSCFRFSLPLPEADPMTLPATRGRVVGLAGDGPTPRILAVDDAVENRELLVKLLGRVGFEVLVAVDGREAVDRWAAERPDLVLMDIRMPGIDGYEATRRIRRLEEQESVARTPIVALTATAFEHDKRTILAAGCDDVVTKPFRDSALFETLGRHLGLRYHRDQVIETLIGGDPGHGEVLGSASGRILVAEDNAANQMVARRMLERLGYTVDVVNDGEAALHAIAEHRFDLILMDVRMPRLDGLAASRRIHETQPLGRPPIVALTGLASDDERQLCHDAGMDDVLPKPFRLDDLKDMVERWLTSGARSAGPRPVETPPSPGPKAETQPIHHNTLREVWAVRPPSSPDASQPIDERALQQLRQLDDGTVKPLAGQIISLYLDTVPDQLAELRRAVSAGDRHRWRRLAHSLKNSSATLGADRVAATCKELESLGRQVDTVGLLQPRAQAVLSRLDEEARQALEALADARREVESAPHPS